jgi:CheY-like chemotaxis protein
MYQIYIADDNIEFSEYLAAVSKLEGWIPEVCTNGLELLERLSKGSGPALLLVDINMPEMDGIEAIEGLVDQDRPLRLRFMTGGGEPSMIAARMIAEARDLMVGRNIYKPITKDSLTMLLRDEADALAAL